MPKQKRVAHPRRRPGSKKARAEPILLEIYRHNMIPLTAAALETSRRLGQVVTKQVCSDILRENNFSRKRRSKTPSYAVPEERQLHLDMLPGVWTRPEQLLSVDEKKFKPGEILDRACSHGYSEIGTRLPMSALNNTSLLSPSFRKCEIIATRRRSMGHRASLQLQARRRQALS